MISPGIGNDYDFDDFVPQSDYKDQKEDSVMKHRCVDSENSERHHYRGNSIWSSSSYDE